MTPSFGFRISQCLNNKNQVPPNERFFDSPLHTAEQSGWGIKIKGLCEVPQVRLLKWLPVTGRTGRV